MVRTTIGTGVSSVASALRLNGLKGTVSVFELAKNLFKALIYTKSSGVHIYLSKDISEKICRILDAMGIEYTIRPVERMKPPYIFIEEVDGKILVLTVDEEDNPVTAVAAPLNTFLDSFINLFKKTTLRRVRKY